MESEGEAQNQGGQGVYRVSARAAPPQPIPMPSWRTLVRPVTRSISTLVVLTLPVVLFNIIVGSGTSASRLVPWVESAESALAAGLPLTFLVLVVSIWRIVRPSWAGLSIFQKIVYVSSTLFAQLIGVVIAETMLFVTHGDFLSATRLLATSTWPGDGRTAYVYESCFLDCTTNLYIAQRHALTMKRIHEVPQRSAADVQNITIEWRDDGTFVLVTPARHAPATHRD